MRLLQELCEGTIRSYVYDPNESYTPLARVMQAGGEQRTEYFHTDLNGAPLDVTDREGNIVWCGKYRAWGKLQPQVHLEDEKPALPYQPLRYPGQYCDDETGLHYNTFRYYDPEVGRFTTQDPIGLAGGLNLYQYGPNPLSWIDPLGLWTYNTMPGIFGFQKHHIIPQQLKGHGLVKAAGLNIHDISNIIYLPKSADYHPTRTIHSGSHPTYTKGIGTQMDALLDYGKSNNWTKTDYKNAVNMR